MSLGEAALGELALGELPAEDAPAAVSSRQIFTIGGTLVNVTKTNQVFDISGQLMNQTIAAAAVTTSILILRAAKYR